MDKGIKNPLLPDFGEGLGGGTAFFSSLFGSLLTAAFIVGFIIFFGTLIYGAINWMLSSGDKAKIEEAQRTISNAFVGIIILFSVFVFIKIVGSFFGIQSLENLIFDIGSLRIK